MKKLALLVCTAILAGTILKSANIDYHSIQWWLIMVCISVANIIGDWTK